MTAGHLGVTGRRTPPTIPQRRALVEVLEAHVYTDVLHHGDCVGVDAIAHFLAPTYEVEVVIHPPTDPRYRAFCDGAWVREVKPERPYLVRNRHIVEAVERLIVVPDGPPRLRSGTWSTARYAEGLYVPRTVVWPTGRVEEFE